MTPARKSSRPTAGKSPRPSARKPDEARLIARVAPERRRGFSRALRAWFARARRDLPWRHTRDPYRVLVSELMLQQTQVDRVIGFYERFLERFPSLESVAEAPQADVLDAWAGLGYYARARNLRSLAVQMVAEGSPAGLPEEPAALRALPGIGPYTAGAVASFAFERRAALIDTNVERVLRRAFAPSLAPKSPRTHRLLWALAEELLPRTGKGTWTHNQALMELGALVCTARVAHCERCPVRNRCATGRTSASPSRGKSATPRPRRA